MVNSEELICTAEYLTL